jgi:hypothetical protein
VKTSSATEVNVFHLSSVYPRPTFAFAYLLLETLVHDTHDDTLFI